MVEYKGMCDKINDNVAKLEISITDMKERKCVHDMQDYANETVYVWRSNKINPIPF